MRHTPPLVDDNAAEQRLALQSPEGGKASLERYLRIEGEPMAGSIPNRIATGARYIDLEGPNMREYFARKKQAG